MLRPSAAILLAVALGLVSPSPALASCVPQTAAEQVQRAQVIAYGSVAGERRTFAPAGPVITFRPERVLKGTLTSSVEVFLGPTRGGAVTSVDYRASAPQRHTLYLRVAADGSYETDACSGSHEGAPTAEEEQLLGAGTTVPIADDFVPNVTLIAIGLGVALAVAVGVVLLARSRD